MRTRNPALAQIGRRHWVPGSYLRTIGGARGAERERSVIQGRPARLAGRETRAAGVRGIGQLVSGAAGALLRQRGHHGIDETEARKPGG